MTASAGSERDIATAASPGLPIGPKPMPRRFHQARWDEPIIFELSTPGARGVLPPATEPGITALVGRPCGGAPGRRAAAQRPPALPELSQLHVVRHYERLSQENLGVDLNIDVGQGTCTMKYSPKVNDQLVRDPRSRRPPSRCRTRPRSRESSRSCGGSSACSRRSRAWTG